jgi:hypothetical protein
VSSGKHYQLATDSNDSTVFDPGGNHRKVYVTAGSNGLSVNDIAAREGISASRINGEWLEQNPEYGASPGMSLNQDAGMMLWNQITDLEAAPSSNWLLLERGHDYSGLGRVIARGATGESPDHPIVVTAWGSGRDPVIESEIKGYQGTFSNIAIANVDLERGMLLLGGKNVLLENLDFTGTGLNAQNVDGLTLRKSTITDVHYDVPQNGAKEWDHASKKQGAFIKASDGVLIEDVFIDHSGWDEGYAYNLSGSQPQAPVKFSHNLYIQKDVTNVIVRDNVFMRGAESGAQIRSGGIVDGNVFIANDSAFNVGGSGSQVLNNLVTLAGYHEVGNYGGALAWGIGNNSPGAVFSGNIVAHHTDPTDSAARASRTDPGKSLIFNTTPRSDDTIVYNWETDNKGRANINLPNGVSSSTLEATTIKNFVEDVLGLKGGTDGVDALATWLKQNWDSADLEAELILDYFQSAFGGGGTTPPKPQPEPEPEEPGPLPPPTEPEPEPEPEPDTDLNLITGTSGNDKLVGTRGDDLFLSMGGGKDVINGARGSDVFLFSAAATNNGKVGIDRIHNFQTHDDVIALEAGVEVESTWRDGKNTVLQLTGDGDLIWLAGVDNPDDIVIDYDWNV